MKHVIAAGHICLDITPVFQGKAVERPEETLRPGKLIEMGRADVCTGGSVANTGLAMKFFGADVRLVGKIGTDEFGGMIRKTLEEHGAWGDMCVSGGESTAYSVILAIPGVDRIVLHHPGANNTFSPDDIPDELLKDCSLFHFGYPPLMRNMYSDEGAELEKILAKARAAGAATSLDLCMVDADTEAGRADWETILERVLPLVDFFVPSVEELCFMLDRGRFFEWQERAEGKDISRILDPERDVRPLGDRCMEMGAKVLLIKCGAPGIYFRTAGEDVLGNVGAGAGLDAAAWADREGFEAAYVPEAVRSGIGAGDTCIAAFLTAMLEGRSPEWCMHLAAAAGASCVSSYDSLSGLLPLNDLEEKIRQGWKKG